MARASGHRGPDCSVCCAHRHGAAPPPTAARRCSRPPRSALAACGEQGIQLAEDDPNYEGARLFDENCAGCHTLDVAGAEGSATKVQLARAQGRPELQRAQGGRRERPLRDPQRRLLLAADAAEPRHRRGRRRRSPSSSPSTRAAAAREQLRLALSARARDARPQADPPRSRPGPGGARAAPRRLRRAARPRARARRAHARAAARGRGAAGAPERGLARRSARAKQAGGDAAEEIAAMQEVAQRVKALGAGAGRRRRRAAGGARHAAQPARPDAPPTRTRSLREVGERAAPPGRDHLELAGPLINAEAGARVVRLALRLPDGRPRAARVRAGALGAVGARRPRLHAGRSRRCSCARRRCTAPASCPTPSSRSTGCPTTTCTSSAPARSPLASLHAGEILDEGALPLRYAGFSPCFRREAGAAGRDTRGIFRVHQFDKLEMFCFVEPPRQSADEHERLLAIEEELLAGARHPVPRGQHRRRRPRLLGRQEVRPRGVDARARSGYGEVTSTSNTTDFQARRLRHPLPAAAAAPRRTRSTARRSRGGT